MINPKLLNLVTASRRQHSQKAKSIMNLLPITALHRVLLKHVCAAAGYTAVFVFKAATNPEKPHHCPDLLVYTENCRWEHQAQT